jgi:hypothetical protein
VSKTDKEVVVNKKINQQWFKQVLKDNELTLRDYAGIVKMDHSQVSRMFRGRRHMYMNEIEAFVEVTGKSVEEVMQNLGIEATQRTEKFVKIVGVINAAGKITRGGVKGEKTTPVLPGQGFGALAFKYQTAGTDREAIDGAVIYCAPLSTINPRMLNRWCVVQTTDDEELVRIIKKGKAGVFNLSVEGKELEKNVRINCASAIEWVKY